MLQTYAQYRPTSFDSRGLGLSDRQSWIVAPVIQTRDSGTLDKSNFRSFLRELGGESDTVEIHRFRHWGPGWFEIILIDANSTQYETAKALDAKLDDYPVVDESDYSELEFETACESWRSMRISDRIDLCRDAGVSIFAARHNNIPCDDYGTIVERLVG